MAEEPGSGTLTGATDGTAAASTAGSPVGPAAALPHESFHGKPVSWAAVTVIVIGFIVGAVGMVPHMIWWLFWTGVGIALVGCLLGGMTKILDDWY